MRVKLQFHNEHQTVCIEDNCDGIPVTIEDGIDIYIENKYDNEEENYSFLSLRGYEAEQLAHAILDAVKASREINREYLEKHPKE